MEWAEPMRGPLQEPEHAMQCVWIFVKHCVESAALDKKTKIKSYKWLIKCNELPPVAYTSLRKTTHLKFAVFALPRATLEERTSDTSSSAFRRSGVVLLAMVKFQRSKIKCYGETTVSRPQQQQQRHHQQQRQHNPALFWSTCRCAWPLRTAVT